VNESRCNVLLVNDDLFEIDMARRAAVEARSKICLTVAKGADAVLNWFGAGVVNKEQIPHLILLDLRLPKLDGLAALRKLRGHAATRDIPIVVFSAQYTQADVLMSYSAGANSFVAKPADFAQLTELFRERLDYWMPSTSIIPFQSLER